MKFTIETVNKAEIELILRFFKKLNLEEVKISKTDQIDLPVVEGDKSENPKELFGIWKNNPRSLNEVRNKAWVRNWEL